MKEKCAFDSYLYDCDYDWRVGGLSVSEVHIAVIFGQDLFQFWMDKKNYIEVKAVKGRTWISRLGAL